MKPKRIATFGPARQTVRVFVEGDLVKVRYRNPTRQQKSWPNTPDNRATAKAYAKGIAEGREVEEWTEPLTLREIWTRFAEAEFPHLREKSRKLYTEFWTRWETMWGAEFIAENTTLIMASQFRAALTKQGKAISTIRHSLETVKMVYKWAERHELITRNRAAHFKFRVGKEERKAAPPEYTNEEYDKLIKALNPALSTEWRPWVALTICRFQGVRQNAVLHLQWADIGSGDLTWRPQWDKVGDEWTQPIHSKTRAALDIACERAKHSPWVLPSGSKKNKGECYTIGALYAALRKAEDRAGITHVKGRGGHGLRRLLAGDINAATGDPALAMMAINDDIAQADRYIQKRDDRVRKAFAMIDKPEDQAKQSSEKTTTEQLEPQRLGATNATP